MTLLMETTHTPSQTQQQQQQQQQQEQEQPLHDHGHQHSKKATELSFGVPDTRRELATWGSTSSCTYNGAVLSITPGILGYNDSGVVLIDQDTSLPLERGSIYALVGANGAGKTSFVQALPEIPGFPKSVLTWEYLSSEQPPQVDTTQTSEEYCLSRIQARMDGINESIGNLETALETAESDEDIEVMTTQLSDLYDVLDDLGIHAASSVGRMMDELEFGDYRNQQLGNLSMGWRYRCDLIAALVTQPTMLIVDEPSFLDSKSTDWLISEFRRLTHSTSKALIILISHKESLLENLTDRILSFNPATRRISVYRCSYRDYLTAHAEQVAHAQRTLSHAQDQQQNSQASVNHIRKQLKRREQNFKARTTADSDKRFIKGKNKEAKQKADHSAAAKAKRAQKKLEEIEAEQDELWQQQTTVALPIEGIDSPQQENNNVPLVTFNEVSFQYDDDNGGGCSGLLMDSIDLQIENRCRILLTGRNGEGKSTLVKLLLGELEATSGEIRRRPFRYIYFPQDALPALVQKYGQLSAVDYIRHGNDDNITDTNARTYLGRFGFKGNLAVSSIRQLSAGQRVRLWLAREYFDAMNNKEHAPSLLVMDEMTENLDVQTIEALVSSLSKLNTAILAISHDPNFSNAFPATERWHLQRGRLWIEHKD